MNVTVNELEGNQLLAGLTGFNKDKGLDLLHEWCYFCSIKECITGEHWVKEPMPIMSNGKQHILYGHRHDQTILSTLKTRHNLPIVLKIWEFYEFRSLDHVKQNNSLFYKLHGSYEDIQL